MYTENNNNTIHFRRNDEAISFVVVFQITILLVKNMFVTTLQFAASYNRYLNSLIFLIMGVIYLSYVLNYSFKLKNISLLLLLGCLIFWLISYLATPQLLNYSYLRVALETFIVYCIPLFIFVPMIKNPDILLKTFHKYARFAAVMSILCCAFVIIGFSTVRDYSMSFGKAAIVPCIVLLICYAKHKIKMDLLLFIGSAVTIVVLGSRWPLLSIVAAVCYVLIRYLTMQNKRKLLIIILLSFTFVIYYLYSDWIFVSIQRTLASYGINSRTINMFVSDNIAYASGRDEIHEMLILKLGESPFFGYGAGGGYIALDNGLPHNFILDAIANFGYPLGITILVSSVWLTLSYFWKNRFSSYGDLIAIYACLFWPKVWYGESFWSSDKYWMLVSLFILGYYLRNKKGLKNIYGKPN